MKSICCHFLLWITLLSFSHVVVGQQTGRMSRANKYFRELNYQNAIKLYEKVLSKEVVPEALFNLPECYRKIGDYRKAEVWYAQAVMHPESTPEMHFYYGLSLLSNGNPKAAQASFEKFMELAPGDMRGPQLMMACKDSVRNLLMNSGALYLVRNVKEINTRFDEFSVTKHRKGLVYCAERDTAGGIGLFTSAWTNRPFTDVYYVDNRLVDEEIMKFKYGRPREFDKIVNTKLHDGPVCFSPDGTTMYFTRNFYNKGKMTRDGNGLVQTQIMSVKMTNTGWEKKAKKIDFARKDYSVAHPALTANGDKMYFASDMPGGFGRMDIYVSYYEGGRWSEPINLGPEINTEGDEVFPWVHPDGTLYFSSDGHTGLGGYDIYSSKAKKGRWSPLENIGSPINSSYDDFGYSIDSSGVFGYFSSNRDSSIGGTDIYSFAKLAVQTDLLVFDKVTGKGIEGVTLSSDCFPRKDFETNLEGMSYLSLPLNRNCEFTVSSSVFGDTTISISTEGYAMGAKLFIQVPIEMKQLDVSVSGTLTNKDSGEPLANATIEVLSSCDIEPQTTTTDENGNYEIEVNPNCQYVVKVIKEGYFTTTTNFNTMGVNSDTAFSANIALPESFNTAMLDTSSVYQIETIYYDYDQDRINLARSTGLQQLLGLMLEQEDLAVEIRAHTDSRGDAAYNQALSARRAKGVADYLIENGISEDRLSYVGLGEAQLLNGCDDFADCTEQEHQVNRRTDFRVIRMNQ